MRWPRTELNTVSNICQHWENTAFLQKQHNKNIKEQFYLAYWHKTYKNCVVPFLNLVQLAREKRHTNTFIVSCTASELWKEAPERSTKNQSA